MKYPKAHKIQRPFSYTGAESMDSDYLKKKLRRIESEIKRQQVVQETVAQKKVSQIRKS